MSQKSTSIPALIARIERAPNMGLVVDAYDAALGGSDVSCHRYRGQWQVWHGQHSGFCGDFWGVRAHLAAAAEEILERAAEAEQVAEQAQAQAPVMVPLPVQQQQACAAPVAGMRSADLVNAILEEMIEACPPAPETRPRLGDVARWSAIVGKDAARLRALHDRAAAGEELSREIAAVEGQLSDARALLAGYTEIQALGGLDGRPYRLVPAWISPRIAVYRKGGEDDETLAFRYPRGLDRAAVLALIDAYEAGCADGRRAASEGR